MGARDTLVDFHTGKDPAERVAIVPRPPPGMHSAPLRIDAPFEIVTGANFTTMFSTVWHVRSQAEPVDA